MKHGLKSHIARTVGVSPQTLCDYLAGRSGASPLIADKLAYLTQTDIRLWLQGGDIDARRVAVENAALK